METRTTPVAALAAYLQTAVITACAVMGLAAAVDAAAALAPFTAGPIGLRWAGSPERVEPLAVAALYAAAAVTALLVRLDTLPPRSAGLWVGLFAGGGLALAAEVALTGAALAPLSVAAGTVQVALGVPMAAALVGAVGLCLTALASLRR